MFPLISTWNKHHKNGHWQKGNTKANRRMKSVIMIMAVWHTASHKVLVKIKNLCDELSASPMKVSVQKYLKRSFYTYFWFYMAFYWFYMAFEQEEICTKLCRSGFPSRINRQPLLLFFNTGSWVKQLSRLWLVQIILSFVLVNQWEKGIFCGLSIAALPFCVTKINPLRRTKNLEVNSNVAHIPTSVNTYSCPLLKIDGYPYLSFTTATQF